VWNFPDGIPQHREPLYSTRADLIDKYPTHDDVKVLWRLPTPFKSLQGQKQEHRQGVPIVLTSGRLSSTSVGEETRSNPWAGQLREN